MKLAAVIALGVLLVVGSILVAAWLFMLGIGAVHDWIDPVPTIGYAAAVAIVAMGRALALPFESTIKR